MKIFENFITKEKESEILNNIPKSLKKETKNRNNIYRYGNSKPYTLTYHISNEIPKVFTTLGIEGFDSVTINEYMLDQSLTFHVDHEFGGEQIVVLSLLGEAEIDFRNIKTKEIKNYLIKPLSLYIIEGDMRWNWQHRAISKGLRYSIVFRKYTPIKNNNSLEEQIKILI